MELLFILPLLLGVGVYEFFTSDSSDSDSSNDTTDDTPTPSATVLAGDGSADVIAGSAKDDVVAGGDANDTLRGNDSDDLLLGERGDDSLTGTQGFDTILGGAGNDDIVGGLGQDLLIGGAGADSINGGFGNDTISGSSGADTLIGFRGDDVISGIDVRSSGESLQVNLQSGATAAAATEADLQDYVTANYDLTAAPDLLARLKSALNSSNPANTADDQLFGGKGNDTLLGDFSDTLSGGDGKDAFRILSDGASEAVTITDLDPSLDTLRITVPAGVNTNAVLTDGATPADGVSVLVAGDVVAILKGLTAADIPAGFIKVTAASA